MSKRLWGPDNRLVPTVAPKVCGEDDSSVQARHFVAPVNKDKSALRRLRSVSGLNKDERALFVGDDDVGPSVAVEVADGQLGADSRIVVD